MKRYVPRTKSVQSKVRIAKTRTRDNNRKIQNEGRSTHLATWMIREED